MPQQLIVFAQRAIAGDGGDKGDAGCLSGHGTWVVNLLGRNWAAVPFNESEWKPRRGIFMGINDTKFSLLMRPF